MDVSSGELRPSIHWKGLFITRASRLNRPRPAQRALGIAQAVTSSHPRKIEYREYMENTEKRRKELRSASSSPGPGPACRQPGQPQQLEPQQLEPARNHDCSGTAPRDFRCSLVLKSHMYGARTTGEQVVKDLAQSAVGKSFFITGANTGLGAVNVRGDVRF